MSTSNISFLKTIIILNLFFFLLIIILKIFKISRNPTLDVNNLASFSIAIKSEFDLYNVGFGDNNKKMAESNWLSEYISDKQIQYYELIKKIGGGGDRYSNLNTIKHSSMHSSIFQRIA